MSESETFVAAARFAKRTLAIGLMAISLHVAQGTKTPALADTGPADMASAPAGGIARTAFDYVTTFYPLWFTVAQSELPDPSLLYGPRRVTPEYRFVVAINVDTLYASGFMYVEDEPLILTFPETEVTYSVLALDLYGNVYDVGLDAGAGSYVLAGPDFDGVVPMGLNRVDLPFNVMVVIVRSDKYSLSGDNQEVLSNRFRKGLTTQPLSDFLDGKSPNPSILKSVAFFSIPLKSTVDFLTRERPIKFLKLLQKAVAADIVPPLSKQDQMLSDRFDELFKGGDLTDAEKAKFAAAVLAAKEAIIEDYLDTRTSTNWTHFNNIGDWGDDVIQRAAITEYCQYCNTIETAAYYHAFFDMRGDALDGTDKDGYVLRFPRRKIPNVQRFWSLTAYTPGSVELIENDQDKYAVASYTDGLVYDDDGSVSIYIARKKPSGVPEANWLPVVKGEFNVMLRLYGPEGNVEDYEPPAIKKR